MNFDNLAKAEAAVRDTRERFQGDIEYCGVAFSVDALIDGGRVESATYQCDDAAIKQQEDDPLVRALDRLTIAAWKKRKADDVAAYLKQREGK